MMPVEPPVETPRTLAEAYRLLASPAVTPIAGGTDLMVRITGELGPAPERVADISRLDELTGIRIEEGALVLGALTTYTELRRSALVAERLPVLAEVAATIGAAQIQNRGTIGGNIANASPAGDTLPLLLALDAEIVVGGQAGERAIPAASFWVAYRTTALAAGELVLRVRIPLLADRRAWFRKVGTRRAQAISKVVMAVVRRQDAPRGPWRDVRVAVGSVADRPVRASAAELALEGERPTLEAADRAAETIAAEIRPIDDVRSSAAYRRMVTARILHRMIREDGGW